MNRISWYFFLWGLLLCTATARAQKEYPIERVSVINVGDGRFLYRDLKTDKPLDGDRRIKNDRVREAGEYRNGHRIGRWKLYDIDGRLEKEWEETM